MDSGCVQSVLDASVFFNPYTFISALFSGRETNSLAFWKSRILFLPKIDRNGHAGEIKILP